MTPDPRDADPLTVPDVPEPYRRPIGRGCSVLGLALCAAVWALAVGMVVVR